MIVAIDGPAGSGKSTIARALARRLGLTYLDTGAMYRVVTLLALEQDVPLESDSRLGCLAREMDVRFVDTPDETARVLVGDRDVTDAIRNPLVSQKVSLVAAHRQVRQALLRRQRQLAEQGDMVLEGRDIGTVVCPRAELKVYLTASAEVRATRRRQQLEEQGVCISQNALERELLLRDSRDSGRVLAPLRKARDAVEIDTSALTVDQVLDLIVEHAAANEPGKARRAEESRRYPLYRTLHVLVPLVFRPLFRMRVSGVEHLPREGAVLLASNHLSNIDPFFIGVACPRQVHFMAKAELWKVGALGRAVEALGGFAVRRGEADRESIRQALGYLKRGAVVGVFPEGHRQPEGCLGQPQAGAALLALQPGVTTVPVALTGTNRILANGRLRLPRVTVSFGPPVSPEDAGATKAQRHMEISTRVMQALADLLGQDWQRAEERS